MVRKPRSDLVNQEPPDDGEEELWFIPGPPDLSDLSGQPGPRADRRPLIDIAEWKRAEAAQASALARAAAGFAALDERLRHVPRGVARRIALSEAEALSWAEGARLRLEAIVLYDALRIAPSASDPAALSEASWAARRLSGGPGPEDGLRSFLGRMAVGRDGLETLGARPVGEEFDRLEEDWRDLMAQAEALHPITRAALSVAVWTVLGLSVPGLRFEAMVVAARVGAAEARGGARFLPVAHRSGQRPGPDATSRLEHWYGAVRDGALAALMQIDRLDAWRAR